MHDPELTENDVRLDPVSRFEWRVCDRRLPDLDHRAVLGVISRTDAGYEAMRIVDPTRSHTHLSLPAALASFLSPTSLGATGGA